MAKKTKKPFKTKELRGGLDTDRRERHDIQVARQPESSYLFKTERPNLQDRERYVVEGFARGLSLESLITGSGYPVRTVYSLIGKDPCENPDEFNRLKAFKDSIQGGR